MLRQNQSVLRPFMMETFFFSKFKDSLAKKGVLRQIFTKNKTRYKQLHFIQVCVKNWFLPKFKPVFKKYAVCVDIAHGIQLAPENCVLL